MCACAGGVRDRTAHDYQRINIDFAGGVAFGSDQGMFIKNGTERMLISANGDVNNNIIMHPSIAEGEVAGETCIVTALWDWSPVASWDSGKHWPSWQTKVHTCTHAHMHTCTHAHMHTCTHAHVTLSGSHNPCTSDEHPSNALIDTWRR